MVESSFNHRVCRICASEANGILIYSEEGKRTCLEGKIKKFLSISVCEEDALPKLVCSSCSVKLADIDLFARMAIKTQKNLVDRINSQVKGRSRLAERMALWQSQFVDESNKSESTGNKGDDDEEEMAESNEDENDTNSILIKDESKGSLLHSILTNRSVLSTNEDVTKLEVRLDPMLFLADDDPDAVNDDDDEEINQPATRDQSGSDMATLSANSSDEDPLSSQNQVILLQEVKPYQCTMCDRGFNSDLGLQNHMWSHIPYPRKLGAIQQLNDYRLQSSNSLLKHKAYRNGCQCSVCGRIYPTMSTLRAHQITHSNLRPHKCSLCDKTFKRNQDLKFHINQHTGERPYRCPYCPKAFASSGNCFSHRKRMHPKQLARDKNKKLSASGGGAVVTAVVK